MEKYFNIQFKDATYFWIVQGHYFGYRNKISHFLAKIFSIVGIKNYLHEIIPLIVPYYSMYPSIANYEDIILKIGDAFSKNDNRDITNIKKTNILYYKLHTNGSLFFWEMQHKYDLINDQTTDIYDINTVSSIRDACVLIGDRYAPSTHINYTNIIPAFMTTARILAYIKQQSETRVSSITNLKINTIISETKKNLDDTLKNIVGVDILHINMRPDIYPSHISNINNFRYLIKIYFSLYIFTKLCDRIKKGGSVCICLEIFDMYYATRIVAIMAYMFETYYLTIPDTNLEKDEYIYIILKNKKDNIPSYVQYLHQLTDTLDKNMSKLYILDKWDNINTADNVMNAVKDNLIYKIKLLHPDIKKLYKRIKKDAKKCNKIFYRRLHQVYIDSKYIYKLQKKNVLTDEVKKKINDKNLYQCIQWGKKYDFPLSINDDKLSSILSGDILKDMFSYEDMIIFSFKKYPISEIVINTQINSDQIPKQFNKHLTSFLSETRALDNRNMDTYHKVKTDIDYYQKKLIKTIKKKHNIRDFVSQAWIKIFEIYTTIKIIPESVELATYKSFHFCELPGSMVYATMFYINHKTKIKNWDWTAQSLNPYAQSTDDERKAFGDQGNILKKYRSHYDFGPLDTGDINDPQNLEYYQNKHGDNDLVTADCGLPYIQKNISNLLAFSMFLSVFSVLKIGGRCIIKRNLPISDNQEIFLLYLTYCVFDQMIIYKPRVNQQSQEYYVIGTGYRGIGDQIMKQMKQIQKNYNQTGLIDITTIPDTFIQQLDKACDVLINNFNHFIKNKIYFADNFHNITPDDWTMIKKISKDKINEWLVLSGLDE